MKKVWLQTRILRGHPLRMRVGVHVFFKVRLETRVRIVLDPNEPQIMILTRVSSRTVKKVWLQTRILSV